VISGIDDPVILAEELLTRVPRDLAELVVDVRDDAALIRDTATIAAWSSA
jgi:hypothetical protein